ncbi:UNVERIFIED_CONTAM: hypothetical protein HHA_214430 [Hammondia hammondi]|eukprot:XP_008886744.1 hypothetical protein HHA_214430 [Hammondia hammondi]
MLTDFRGSENSPSIPRAGVSGSGARLRRLAEGGSDKESTELGSSAECAASALASLTLGSTTGEAGNAALMEGSLTHTMQVAAARTLSGGLLNDVEAMKDEVAKQQKLLLKAIRDEGSYAVAYSGDMLAAVLKAQKSLQEVLDQSASQDRQPAETLADVLRVALELHTDTEITLLESERQAILQDLQDASTSGVEDASLAPAALLREVEQQLQEEAALLVTLTDTLHSSFTGGDAAWETTMARLLGKEEQRAAARLHRRTRRLRNLLQLSRGRFHNAEEKLKGASGQEAKKHLYMMGDMGANIRVYEQQLSLYAHGGKQPLSPLAEQLAETSALVLVILKQQTTEEQAPPKPWEAIEQAIVNLTEQVSRQHVLTLNALSSGAKRELSWRKRKLSLLLQQRQRLQGILRQARQEGTDV